MGRKPKITCSNNLCKYNDYANKGCLLSRIELDADGCTSFEKGFQYYINKVWRVIYNTNIIPINRLDDELKIGLYYVMKIFNLTFATYNRGSWEWVSLTKDEKALSYNDICNDNNHESWFNIDEYKKLNEDFLNGILPTKEIINEERKVKSQPFGWLSPTGVFTESDWGEHESSAYDIIVSKLWEKEWSDWKFSATTNSGLARDFICQEKGYALIDNPCGDGGYNVTHIKLLTKAQREFLYGYFKDMGNTLRAEMFLEDE